MIIEANRIAHERGGNCLGPTNLGQRRSKYIWECEKGHTWEARLDSIKSGGWCPKCNVERQKNTIEEMRELAWKHGGECLSEIYENSYAKLIWKCKEGHIFKATPSHIQSGRWCRQCGNKQAGYDRRISFQEIREIAHSRNGRCLSENYDPPKNLKWQCEYGHIWEAGLHSIKSGSWCPICARGKGGRKRLTIEEMHDLAASHGGKCLSEQYTNSDSKLSWMCENRHIWEALPLSIKKGHWCPVCSGNQKLDIEQVKKLAIERGGKCLSEQYYGNHKKLEWQCSEGHAWLAKYSNIHTGRWCPVCSTGLGERICREYFEQLFGYKFPKTRPSWLINQDGFQMELDGYCEELRIAFEHHGRQHYRLIDFYYQTKNQFQKRQADDITKKGLCNEHKITLIVVPQIPDLLPLPKTKKYILNQCKENGFKVTKAMEEKTVELLDAFSPSSRERMDQIQEIAISHGGICLSQIYAGMNVKLHFRCIKGHEWDTLPGVVLKGHWCPICSSISRGKARRLTIEDMQAMARDRGGKCISQEYVNANTHLIWECKDDHQWRAIPNSIKRGSWCPVCSKLSRSAKRNI